MMCVVLCCHRPAFQSTSVLPAVVSPAALATFHWLTSLALSCPRLDGAVHVLCPVGWHCEQYNEELGRRMTGLLPYAVILHSGFAVWMYSNKHIFETDELTITQV